MTRIKEFHHLWNNEIRYILQVAGCPNNIDKVEQVSFIGSVLHDYQRNFKNTDLKFPYHHLQYLKIS